MSQLPPHKQLFVSDPPRSPRVVSPVAAHRRRPHRWILL